MRRSLILVLACCVGALAVQAPFATPTRAQARLVSLVSQETGHVALGLAIRRLGVSGTLLQAVAHPDDEHNQLYAMLVRGQGLRAIDVQTTRGDGGQNEIGPELFQDLAVLRTSELLAAHRLDGAEQWFTRAIDFGYSFDPNEVIEQWGRREVVGDFVRLIRTFRPDVVLTMNIQGRGGDRAHEATAVLMREAYHAAADPSQYPEQVAEGLKPWQASKLYFTAGFSGGSFGGPPAPPTSKLATIDTSAVDELLGRTYDEIGADARGYHKCQGLGQLLTPLPGITTGRFGFGSWRYQLVDTTLANERDRDETSLFEGLDTSLAALAAYAGPNPPAALTAGLSAIAGAAATARKAFDTEGDAATAPPIAAGLEAVRALRAKLGAMGLPGEAAFEIDFRLNAKERDYQDALLAAYGITFQALADDGLVVAGQGVKVTLTAVNRGPADIAVDEAALAGFDTGGACARAPVKRGAAYACTADVTVPKDARLTAPYWTDQYWNTPTPKAALDIFELGVPFGAPFRPSPFRAAFRLTVGGARVTADLPVQYRSVKDVFAGEKRFELTVVPAFSVQATPAAGIVPVATGAAVAREVHVSVTSGLKTAVHASVALVAPGGWTVAPASAPLDFSGEDESLSVRFTVTAPASVAAGTYRLQAVVTSPATPNERYTQGYQEIDYPHVERRQVIKPAETALKVMRVRVAPDIRLGYIVGAGDQVPPALEQLGAKVNDIGPDELAWGDLSKYDVIMTGVRAYERRADLRAYNRRLLDFAQRGGTVIVQYNKMEFNRAQYGPYPAKVGNGRVTDEHAPVTILMPANPVFNAPNRIDDRTWQGWVQERGLYFLGEKDPRYVDLLSMQDTFKDNPGVKLGSLVEATVGRGRWLYVGLGLWRQLPAQTEGAYQLLANLISLPRTASPVPAGPRK
jgi:LmbE family N-acetylglucosaminyl deacetylase